MPMDPGFENPQSAYVAISSDLGCWESEFWEYYSNTYNMKINWYCLKVSLTI
jgi:hypothetical protein